MSARQWLLIILAAWVIRADAADSLPTDLVGEWATEKSEFYQDVLSRGVAMYLTAHGIGALVGAPPLVAAMGPATYDAKTRALTLRLAKGTCEFIHDPKAKTFKAQAPECGTEVLKRRRDYLPDHIVRILR